MAAAPGPAVIDRAALARRMAALSPQQRELLRQQLAARGIQVDLPAEQTESGGAQDGALPLSAAQSHLWVVHQLQPQASAYHIALRWTFTGALDVAVLARALQSVVERHQALRTGFVAQDGRPSLQLQADARITFDTEAFAGDDAALDGRLRELAVRPFDLAQAPLVRATLLDCGGGCRVLALVLHHLVADGWSRGVLLRELAAFYRAGLEQGEATLPPLPAQYADYVRAQQVWLAGADCQRQTAYWQRQLAGVAPLDLPTDRPRSSASDYASRTLSRSLSPALRARLLNVAKAKGATPFMLLLALFNVLLHRYSGRRDIAVGIPVAGRNLPDGAPDVSGLIGFFVNTLVIRARPADAARLSGWIDAVKQSVADAFDNADLPFAKVVEAMGTARDASRTPLFETMFQYQSDSYRAQNAESLDAGFPGVEVEQGWIELAHTKFDLSWHVLDRESGLLLAVEYRSALFDEARVTRMLGHFENLLIAVCELSGDGHVGALPLLADDEVAQIARWQRTPQPLAQPPVWRSTVARFEQQVRDTPLAEAVAAPGLPSYSYAELNARANRFARRLQHCGVRAESLVGVCLPRRPELMTALLGTMKAGAAYVPLDPVLPAERLRYMVEDAGLAVLVTTHADAARLFDGLQGTRLLIIDDADEQAAQAALDDGNPDIALHPHQLAYTIYTSGSTGRPKGTLLTHAGLIHYLDWCLAMYPVEEGLGAPVNSSIGFDATITGLYAPLLVGRTVMLLPEADPLAALVEALSAGYSLVKLTPAHLSALQPLLEATPLPPDAKLPGAFIIGGEALTEAHIEFWRSQHPQIQLINEYGPTETVVGCCYYRATAADHGPIAIGHPISGALIYLLDDYLNPVPQGMAGEIFIGGTGMARGYLNRPELSAERFVPDPYAGAPGAVMYRTGDLAVQRPDGMVVYLGRADQQLQLRGYRIEPGEIESALCRLPEVAEAVVLVRDIGRAPMLVAWLRMNAPVAATEGAADIGSALRSRIAQWLPAYMLPTHYVALDAFPLTPNGKVDRAALPLPAQQASGRTPASNDAERALLGIWCEVLRRDGAETGIDDNFFDLGGDSVSAMQIVARARSAGLVLAPADIFEHQTIAAQAAAARPAPAQQEDDVASGEAALAPVQWAFLQRAEAGDASHYNQSVLLDVAADTDAGVLARALDELPLRHAALRLRFARAAAGGRWLQQYADAAPVPLQQVSVADAAALQAVMAEAQRSLDIAHGPVLRAVLCDLSDGSRRLLLAVHHLVVDGMSWRLLVTELAGLYQALQSGGEPPPAVPAPHYGRWSAALAASLPQFERDAAYWRAVGAPAATLPLAAAQASEAEAVDIVHALDADATGRLLGAVTGGLSAGIDELLLTALAQTLARWLQTDTVLIDVEGHGRQPLQDGAPDMSRTVGWFTALWPLRLAVPAVSPPQQLDAVKQVWRAVPHHGIGHGVLRMAGRLPDMQPAQILFNYLGRVNSAGGGFVRGLAPETVPAQRSPAARRTHALEVVALVRDGALQFIWRHAPGQLASALVEQLAARCIANLRTLIALAAPTDATAPAAGARPPAARGNAAAQALLARLRK